MCRHWDNPSGMPRSTHGDTCSSSIFRTRIIRTCALVKKSKLIKEKPYLLSLLLKKKGCSELAALLRFLLIYPSSKCHPGRTGCFCTQVPFWIPRDWSFIKRNFMSSDSQLGIRLAACSWRLTDTQEIIEKDEELLPEITVWIECLYHPFSQAGSIWKTLMT